MTKKQVQVVRKSKSSRSKVVNGKATTLVDRFLTDPFGSWQGLSTPDQRSLGEVEETRDAYILSAELPGTSLEEVKISVHGKHLCISAEHQEHYGTDDNDHNFHHSCRSFQQTFALPETVDAEKIQARCKNGLLQVFMPKKALRHKVELTSSKVEPSNLHHQKGH